jgi:hypothetical protein
LSKHTPLHTGINLLLGIFQRLSLQKGHDGKEGTDDDWSSDKLIQANLRNDCYAAGRRLIQHEDTGQARKSRELTRATVVAALLPKLTFFCKNLNHTVTMGPKLYEEM